MTTATVPEWLEGVERADGKDAGSWLPLSKWCLLLHTTEGSTIEGALAALRAKDAWSHFVYDAGLDRLVQCVPLTRAARSLKSGGSAGTTNRARVIQVEVVGFSAASPQRTDLELRNLGALVARLARVIPFDVAAPLKFYGQDAGFTVASSKAPQRLSWAAWYRFAAICGHQHAPANDHWDPGALDVPRIVQYALELLGRPTEEALVAVDEDRLRVILREELEAELDARGLDTIPRSKRDGKGNLLLRVRDAVAHGGPRELETVRGIRSLLRRK